MKHILITGGAGFIGSNLAGHFSRQGWRVTVCDVWGTDDKWRNLSAYSIADLVHAQDISPWLAEFGETLAGVIHMGAISSTTETDLSLIVDTNVGLSRALWKWCAQWEKQFIYASSAATYGDGTQGFIDRDDKAYYDALRPLNPYAWSKLTFDRFVAAEIEANALIPPRYAGVKFFNVYGPREQHKGPQRSVFHQWFEQVGRGEKVRLFTSHRPEYEDGGQCRDFIHVRDCVRVIDWLWHHPNLNGMFNIGTGQARSFLDGAHALYAALERPMDIEFIPMPESLRDTYQYYTQADMTKLRKAGYTAPFDSLEEGVARYVRYLQKEKR